MEDRLPWLSFALVVSDKRVSILGLVDSGATVNVLLILGHTNFFDQFDVCLFRLDLRTSSGFGCHSEL